MTKEIKFDNYLRDKEITFFDKFAYEDGGAAYRSNYTISGNNILFIISMDDSVYTILQCRLMKLNNPAKREKMLYLLNQLNSHYKANKFVLTDDDNIDFSVPFIAIEEDFNPEILMLLTHSILEGLEEDYAKIMRVIWS
ncbi:YbjN domain-containing protein [Clostridium sp. UBA1353]|uniref:YbjN domain-containing protein n=1 Tax=Clostridium sp. UBA1353 TaxID=1946347 RepID=UPI001243288E